MAHLGILCPVAVAAGVAAGWVIVSAPNPEAAPVTAPVAVIETRFAAEFDQAALPPPAWFLALRDEENLRAAHFHPYQTEVAPPAPEPAAERMMLASASATPEIPKPPARPKKASAPASNNVLNDAQIASIKQRLRLTRDQEAYWPAVEEALREIAWNKKARAHNQRVVQGDNGQAIDVNSPPVQKLKSAAFPLLMSFSSEQKQEVRELVHVIGLGKLAQEF